jgi:hypothetical protein
MKLIPFFSYPFCIFFDAVILMELDDNQEIKFVNVEVT